MADATSEADTERLFDLAGNDLALAIYNTGNNTPGRIADMSAEYFEKAGECAVLAVFCSAKQQSTALAIKAVR